MTSKVYEVEYAGHILRYSFQYPGTRAYFLSLIRPSMSDRFDIMASLERVETALSLIPEECKIAYAEFRSLIGLTALKLLSYDCCIFHSVSFVWNGYAFLLCAPSGTGKTTQFFNWQRLYPGEITMISGDMPVLERREDGSVWAHHSPWNGKERVGNRICAPVGGIVLLEQGRDNRIAPLPARDAILPFFKQFIVRPETEEQIRALSRLMDQMLKNIPIWKLVNLGDDASTELLRETLSQRLNDLTGGQHGDS